MKNTVQYQNSYLFRGRVPEATGILPRDVSGDRKFASNLFRFTQPQLRRWKRQYIGSLVFPAELTVERSQFVAICH